MATSIIKCYDTEENALNGGATGLIASSTAVDSFPYAFTVNSIGNGIYNRADHVPFYIFNRYWFRFESNDPVIAFHIDWDDGNDNSPTGQNFQMIELVKPGFFGVTSHTYSKIGTFWPLIRCESEMGFLSKWYTNDNNTGYKLKSYFKASTGTDTVPAGRQNKFIVREEKTSSIGDTIGYRIPHMRPANLPPIGVIKSNNKRIYAGIDNERIAFRSGQKPLLYAWTDSSNITNGGHATNCNVKVTLEVEGDDDAQIREYTIPVQLDDDIHSGTWASTDIRDDCAPSGGDFGAGAVEVQTFTFGAGDEARVDINGTPTAGGSFNEKFIKIAGGTAGISATNFIVHFKHAAVQQSARLVVGDATPGAMGNPGSGVAPYIDLRASVNSTHRFWLDCSGSNAAPSAPSSGFLEKIDISSDTNANQIAATIDAAIENGITIASFGGGTTTSDQFSSSVAGNVVTITHAAGYIEHDTYPWALNYSGHSGASTVLTLDIIGEAAGGDCSLGGHTAIAVEFTSGDSASSLASAMATAVNANANFTASAASNVVTVSPVVTGNMTAPDITTVNGSNTTQDPPSITLGGTDGSASSGSINPARRLFKAKLNDVDTLADNDRVYIKVHNFDLDTDGTAYPTNSDETVAILSNGNPIVELNDRLYSSLLDGGESHTRAGNTIIKNYYFDLDNNLITSGAALYTDSGISNSVGELTGKLSSYFNNFSDYTKEVAYTHHNSGFSTDSNGRFENFSRLCRVQVEDDSARFLNDSAANEGDNITRSIIDLTASRTPDAIMTIRLNARKSYTKGATLTQASTGATGTVLHTTYNQNYVQLINTSQVSNFDSSGTAFTVSSNALVSDGYGDDDDGYPLTVSGGTWRGPHDFFEKGSNKFILKTSNRSGISNISANFSNLTTLDGAISSTTAVSFDVDSASGLFIGDVLKIDSEYMKIKTISSVTIGVKRGYFGSTVATHSDAANVARGSSNWQDAIAMNDDGTNPIIGGSATNQQWNVSTWTASNSFQNDMPENFIRMSQQKKWNGIYLRTGHSFKPFIDAGAATGPAKVKLSMWYSQVIPPNKDTTTQIYDWKPLPFIDGTHQLRTSGVLKFLPPEDWAYCTDNDLCENNGTYATTDNWKGPILNDSAKTSYLPYYHILVGWTAKNDNNNDTHMAIQHAWPLGNQHSVVIDVIDPHHVNLNAIALAQSIGYSRKGKYNMVTDKLGKTDIRRIGAEGGRLSFGGIDLGSDNTGRNLIKGYQQNGTPVYLDVTHKDSSKTRFFGVITSMSEDYATGGMSPKWAVQLECSYCIELSSTGVMTSEKISLGGVFDDVSKYLLQS